MTKRTNQKIRVTITRLKLGYRVDLRCSDWEKPLRSFKASSERKIVEILSGFFPGSQTELSIEIPVKNDKPPQSFEETQKSKPPSPTSQEFVLHRFTHRRTGAVYLSISKTSLPPWSSLSGRLKKHITPSSHQRTVMLSSFVNKERLNKETVNEETWKPEIVVCTTDLSKLSSVFSEEAAKETEDRPILNARFSLPSRTLG